MIHMATNARRGEKSNCAPPPALKEGIRLRIGFNTGSVRDHKKRYMESRSSLRFAEYPPTKNESIIRAKIM